LLHWGKERALKVYTKGKKQAVSKNAKFNNRNTLTEIKNINKNPGSARKKGTNDSII